MNPQELEVYTKDESLYGQDDQKILDRFMQYINMCKDPLNIYRFMQQKSICIYLGNYWLNKAQLFADMGDFTNSVICLKQAKSRDHIINQNDLHFQERVQNIYKKIITAMKRKPPISKRSAQQYSLIYDEEDAKKKKSLKDLQKITEIYSKRYLQARKYSQRIFNLKMKDKPKSWLAPIEQVREQNIHKIQQKIKSMSNQPEQYFSMRTPISKKDPMRLTKTMDSVQMMRKKKSTGVKDRKNHKGGEETEDQEVTMTPDMRSMPVGGFSLKRRVTFDTNNFKIEKLRAEESKKSQKQNQSLQKGSELTKRQSILKNKLKDSIKLSSSKKSKKQN